MLVNPELLLFVQGFGVCPFDELPTHATLQVLLDKTLQDSVTVKSVKPASPNKPFYQKLTEAQEQKIHDPEHDEADDEGTRESLGTEKTQLEGR